MSAAAKIASVMAMDWRYSMLGLQAKKAAAATAAGVEWKIRRAAANKNNPASTKQIAGAMDPARPLRQRFQFRTNGRISRCGSGSQGGPSWS